MSFVITGGDDSAIDISECSFWDVAVILDFRLDVGGYRSKIFMTHKIKYKWKKPEVVKNFGDFFMERNVPFKLDITIHKNGFQVNIYLSNLSGGPTDGHRI